MTYANMHSPRDLWLNFFVIVECVVCACCFCCFFYICVPCLCLCSCHVYFIILFSLFWQHSVRAFHEIKHFCCGSHNFLSSSYSSLNFLNRKVQHFTQNEIKYKNLLKFWFNVSVSNVNQISHHTIESKWKWIWLK